MKITRFSEDGFVPKHQTHYLDLSNRLAGSYIATNCEYGIYVFVNGKESNMLLNHLSENQKQNRIWWNAEIDDDAMVYISSPPCFKVDDEMLPISKCNCQWELFIPIESIKFIKNIKQTGGL